MAEVKDLEQLPETAPEQAQEAPQTPAVPLKERWRAMPRKKRRRIIRWTAILLVLAILAAILLKVFGGKGGDAQVVTDVVQYGSITSVVENSGLTKAKSSETITLTTTGTVMDVLVAEGEKVTAGTPLFVVESPAAETAVQKARSNVEGYEKQLAQAQKDLAGLNFSAPFAGKIMLKDEHPDLQVGDEVAKGAAVAELNDDTRLRLEQYYSYAYAGDLYVGQSVNVSIPALMTSIPGTVEAVHMVSRITPEGSKLFSAEIVVNNEGSLTAEMAASATVTVGGETVYPYEPGKLEYYRSTTLTTTVGGTVLANNLVNYLQVSAGQVLLQIDAQQSESELFTIQQNLETAKADLEAAEKNLANCKATAPIDGMVIGLTMQPGDEIAANTAVVTISDTSAILVSANVDERNISYIKPGMPVELDQWGTPAFGTVETVSLSSTVNNGVATYPITISVDNSEGTIQVNSYINFKITASENDNCLVLPLQCVRKISQEDGTTVDVVFVKGSRPENAIETPMLEEEIPSGFWAVPVEIGISDNTNVEIKSGVEAETEVFTQIQSIQAYG